MCNITFFCEVYTVYFTLPFNEVIETSLGNFKCYVIRTIIVESDDYPGFLEIYEYYAPNLGLVAKVRIFIVPNAYWFLDYVYVLKNYRLQ